MPLKIELETKTESDPCVAAWDGQLFVATEDGSIKSFDANLKPGAFWKAHDVQAFALAASGGRVYSASNDGGIKVWSQTGEKVADLPMVPEGGDIGTLHVFGKELYAGDANGNAFPVVLPSSLTCSATGRFLPNRLTHSTQKLIIKMNDTFLGTPAVVQTLPLDGAVIVFHDQHPGHGTTVLVYQNNDLKAMYFVLEEVKDLWLDPPMLFTSRDLDVTVTEIFPDESKNRFVTIHTMEGRAPLRTVGKYFLVMARGGNDLILKENSLESGFKTLHSVKASDMIVSSLDVSGDTVWTGGWDKQVRCWKISENSLQPAGSIDIGGVINGIVTTAPNTAYAIASGGRIVRLAA